MIKVSVVKNNFSKSLTGFFCPHEILSMWNHWVVKEIFQISSINYYLDGDFFVKKKHHDQIQSLVLHLLSKKPIQYFFGYTYFKDLKIQVDSNVLIPRPETEQLIDLICDSLEKKYTYKIIDIGTGSGCIAIALKKAMKADMLAIDISNNAIKKAKMNAQINNVLINFKLIDIISCENHQLLPKIDIIVSNPPYVLNSEVDDDSVVHAEPDFAIFVPNDNPLIFYDRICQFAKNNLSDGGKIFFEINPIFTSSIVKIIQKYGYFSINIHQDFMNKNRFIVVSS